MSEFLGRISKISLILLFSISIIISVLFFIDIENSGNSNEVTKFTSILVEWNFILLYIAVGLGLFFAVFAVGLRFIDNPKKALKSLIPFIIAGIIMFVSYLSASDALLNISGYKGSDNIPITLKWADAGLIMTWILVGISILTIIFAEVYKMFK